MKAISMFVAAIFLVSLATPPALAVTRGPASHFSKATKRTGIDPREELMRRQQVRDRAKSIAEIRTSKKLKNRSTARIKAEIGVRSIGAAVAGMRPFFGDHNRTPVILAAGAGMLAGVGSWALAVFLTNWVDIDALRPMAWTGIAIGTLFAAKESYTANRSGAAPQHDEELIQRGNAPDSSLRAKIYGY